MIRAAILGLIINTVTTFLINPSHPHFMISLSINLFLLSVAIGRVFKKQFDIKNPNHNNHRTEVFYENKINQP